MSWIEKTGRYLALACLFLVWPALDDYLRGTVPGVEGVALGVAVAAYSGIYGWYCLHGHRIRDTRVPLATAALLTLLALALDHLSGEVANNYFLIPMLVVGFGLRPRYALVALGLVGAITTLDGILLARMPTPQLVLQAVLVVPAVALFGGSAMGLRTTVAELRSARIEIAQHATERERTRIARDLHDLLGHSLSLITLKGELATRLLPEGVRGADEVRDMVGLSREALQLVRQAVSGYRQPTLATELSAARVALQAAGVEFDVEQSVGALDRDTEAVLGWVIREATTNVTRHSGAKRCQISLTRGDRQLEIEIQNDGWRIPQTPAGNGLRGLEERLAVLGGKLEASALPGAGFRLRATIPEQAQAEPTAVDVEASR
jgi:two-component system sensor histidine kinase DesK